MNKIPEKCSHGLNSNDSGTMSDSVDMHWLTTILFSFCYLRKFSFCKETDFLLWTKLAHTYSLCDIRMRDCAAIMFLTVYFFDLSPRSCVASFCSEQFEKFEITSSYTSAGIDTVVWLLQDEVLRCIPTAFVSIWASAPRKERFMEEHQNFVASSEAFESGCYHNPT